MNNTRIVFNGAILALVAVMCYVLGAFTEWEVSPAEWRGITRCIVFFVFVVAELACLDAMRDEYRADKMRREWEQRNQ